MVMADRLVILDAGRAAQTGTPEEIYNRPNSPFVASFMGAGNIMKLSLQRAGNRIAIGAGPCNDAVEIDAGRVAETAGGEVNAHFRSEDARLCAPDQATENCLVLRGEIVQCSYPGGFYRYAVRVGPHQYLVDDASRLAIGNTVGIALPASALHFYTAPTNVQ
jgi:putative spermidine/putrescine transport system ATP-binding protein